MATYYVDATTGSDSDDGLSEDDAWQTISKVNGESFSPNDSILFKRGEVWRERLQPGDSGSAGDPVTFGVYGSGAKPIISGSDIITGFSSAGSTVLGPLTLTTDNSSPAFENFRTVLPASEISAGGTSIRIKLEANSASDTVIDGCSIGQRSGSTPDYSSAPTRVTFDTGSSGVTISSGGTKWSDWITFTLDDTKDHLFHVYNDTGIVTRYIAGKDTTYKVTEENDVTMTEDVSSASFLPGTICFVTDIEVASTVYTKGPMTTEPQQVFSDDVKLTENDGATTGVASGEWDWAADTLYINTGEDPSGNVIEAGQRDQAALVFQVDYIDLDSLRLQHGNTHGLQSQRAENCNYTNLVCTYNKTDGVFVAGASGDESTETLIQNCETSFNGNDGIEVSVYTHNCTARRVLCHDNALEPAGDAAGIYFAKNPAHAGSTWTGHTIEHCSCYDNGLSGEVAGIRVDEAGDGGGHNVRYNHCYGNPGPGIWIEVVDTGLSVYYNVCRDNVGSDASDSGIGIRVGHNNTGVTVYNNVMYGNRVNLLTGGYVGSATPNFDNNIFKNNITLGAVTTEFAARFGGENDGSYGSGNVYTYNCFGAEASNFIEWGNASFEDTYDTWETAYGSGTNSVEADPLFVNAGGVAAGAYKITSVSPCVDAGTDVSLTQDYAGGSVPKGAAQDIGAFEVGGLGIVGLLLYGAITG